MSATKYSVVRIEQLNRDIQDTYIVRALPEPLGGTTYTDRGVIFDIMTFTVIQKELEISALVGDR